MKLQEVKEKLLEIDSLISGLGEQEVMYGPKELVGSLFEEIGRLAQQEVKEGEMGVLPQGPLLEGAPAEDLQVENVLQSEA